MRVVVAAGKKREHFRVRRDICTMADVARKENECLGTLDVMCSILDMAGKQQYRELQLSPFV